MRRNFPRFSFLALFALLGIFTSAAQAQPRDEINILFIGNSLTYVNDLPKMVAELARAGKQRPIHHERETPGGCTLEKHWKDGKALKKIQSRKWDYVVLQDQSQIPLRKRAAMFDYGKKFDAEIKKQGAKTILYMTWALEDKPADQPPISNAYLNLAGELHSKIAPVGTAWQMTGQTGTSAKLYQPDKKHPQAAGTYLAACVFYATIFGQSPEGLPGTLAHLTDQQARSLQTTAWKAVQTTGK